MKKAVKVIIKGIVQGIFFRAFVKEKADRMNVTGYVRNLEDGRVEAFLEGSVDAVNAMIEICRRGPPHSKIEKIEVIDERYQGMKDFKILRI